MTSSFIITFGLSLLEFFSLSYLALLLLRLSSDSFFSSLSERVSTSLSSFALFEGSLPDELLLLLFELFLSEVLFSFVLPSADLINEVGL